MKEHKTLLQWRREIEERLEDLKGCEMIDDIIENIDRIVQISYEDSFREEEKGKTVKLYNKANVIEEFAKRVIGE